MYLVQMQGSRNQRTHARVRPSPRAPIEIQVMGDGFLDILVARDISLGGLGVHVEHNFVGCNIEESVDLVIKLPHEKAFIARGCVRHLTSLESSHLFGVQFTQLPPGGERLIEAYVRQRLAEGGGT